MKRIIFFLFVLSSALYGEGKKQDPLRASGKEPEVIYNARKNFPITSHYLITPKVNVVTGEYLEDACDLVVAGAEPLALTRFYGHYASHHPQYNFWRYNPEHF